MADCVEMADRIPIINKQIMELNAEKTLINNNITTQYKHFRAKCRPFCAKLHHNLGNPIDDQFQSMVATYKLNRWDTCKYCETVVHYD